jgi:hypothetical protein
VSEFNFHGPVSGSQIGDHGVMINNSAGIPVDVVRAFAGLQQSVAAEPADTSTQVAVLASELASPTRTFDRIVARIAVVTAVAGATGAVAEAADALTDAVRAWL